MKLFLDGASLADMRRLGEHAAGFTTNPSLMKAEGVRDYAAWAREVLAVAVGKPVSFEVLGGHKVEMAQEARAIAKWGPNVYVKIPIIDIDGRLNTGLIKRLGTERIKVNVTAVLTAKQAEAAADAIGEVGGIVSVFAGRIADTLVNPDDVIEAAASSGYGDHEVLWASPREVYNIRQAEEAGADIITLPPALFDKMLALRGKDLEEYSLETVRQFAADAEGISL